MLCVFGSGKNHNNRTEFSAEFVKKSTNSVDFNPVAVYIASEVL